LEVEFAGLVPGGIGLAQFSVRIPDGAMLKGDAGLVIRFGDVSSPRSGCRAAVPRTNEVCELRRVQFH
jgi:uncharacterized protein (TIGR03437 family)